ncbi:hypothetical protein ACHQM5_008051 [Ranunculus cassubicifolius]
MEVTYEFPPFIRVYKDGHSERILHSKFIPPSLDSSTGVTSKDVIIDSKTGVSARLYLPQNVNPLNKLPLLIYIHGGGFCIESAFSPTYHNYLNSLVAESNVVGVSVEYRRAPESPLPICYEDSWTALQWVISQSGEEEWFKNYADFGRVFLAGDSAGGNIAHNVAIRAGVSQLKELNIVGLVLIHPLFIGVEPVGDEVINLNHQRAGKLWRAVCPAATDSDDPRINPVKDPEFSRLGTKRVLVCVAEKDALKDRGRLYYEKLGESGWDGVVEFMETQGVKHVFHLYNPSCEKARELMKRVVSFLSDSH